MNGSFLGGVPIIGTTWQSQNHSKGLLRCARNDSTYVCLFHVVNYSLY